MPSKAEALVTYTTDYNRLRAQKSREVGSVELRMLTNLAFVSGEHWVGSEEVFRRRALAASAFPSAV